MSTFLVVVLKIDRNICSYTVELSYSIIKGTKYAVSLLLIQSLQVH